MSAAAELCQLQKTVDFEDSEETEMHTTLTITNLVDRVVSYKIKTNKAGLYLVKPTEGQIFNNDTIKIVIKRRGVKESNLSLSASALKEKFLIQFTSTKKDAVAREIVETQTNHLAVRFLPAVKKGVIQSGKGEKVAETACSDEVIARQRAELSGLTGRKAELYGKKAASVGALGLEDLVLLTLIAFMVGFIV